MSKKNKKTKILITYIKAGGGHGSIAQGLKERLEDAFKQDIEIVISEPVNSWMDYAYQASTAFSPVFFNLLYSFSQKQKFIIAARKFNSLVNKRKLRKYIQEISPDVIISTHFLIADEVKNIKKDDGTEIPVVIYVADPFHPHPIWFFANVDLFLTFDTQDLPRGVIKQKGNKIIPIGMPIREAFFKTYDRVKVLRDSNLDPSKFTIIFGGSGSGMDGLERIANKFRDLESDTQAIFICGRNVVLQKALAVLFRNDKNVKVFGYLKSEQIAGLLQSSDLFIGKVGPNIMFEAVLSGIPIIATPPILGQEVVNRKYIKRERLGFLTKGSSETIKILKKILKDPKTIEEAKGNMTSLRKKLILREEKELPQFITWMREHVMRDVYSN